jgi:limonene-1,2-epoxide hydrolase
MTATSPVDVVANFHRHLADSDADAVIALAHQDVEVGGPRGTGIGSNLLREWVGRANVTMTPVRWFAKDDVVIVEQDAVWRDSQGEERGRQDVTTTFRIRDGRIAGIYRHDNLAASLTVAGLDASDEIDAPVADS